MTWKIIFSTQVTNNGRPCSDKELDSECDEELDSDDKLT